MKTNKKLFLLSISFCIFSVNAAERPAPQRIARAQEIVQLRNELKALDTKNSILAGLTLAACVAEGAAAVIATTLSDLESSPESRLHAAGYAIGLGVIAPALTVASAFTIIYSCYLPKKTRILRRLENLQEVNFLTTYHVGTMPGGEIVILRRLPNY